MLRIESLPAGHGDCLWIEYGDPGNLRRVLVDGGATGTYKRALRPRILSPHKGPRPFELLVVTHIDGDHITGVLELLADRTAGFEAADIWFNGYRHLPDEAPDTLGPVQGEKLTDLLLKPGVRWNDAFRKRAAAVPKEGDLPRLELEGGLILTLLSPTIEGLVALKPVWEDEVIKAGLDPNTPRPGEAGETEGLELLDGGPPDIEELAGEPFSEDASEANGSSIALILEHEGHRVLLAGDAHPTVLDAGIRRFTGGGRVRLDACKLPHHGSKANVSRKLLDALDCDVYVFSTNGAYFKHPDRAAVARVIKWGGSEPALTFNYRSKYNGVWEGKPLREEYGYKAIYPDPGSDGAVLEWK